MSAFSPRRSARLAQDQSHSFGSQSSHTFTFSQPSSTSTSSHPSPANDSLNPPPPPPTPQQANLRQQAQNNFAMNQQSQLDAPLPSPAANNTPFFSSRGSQPNNPFQQSAQNSSPFDPQSQNQQQPQHLHPHSNSISQPHPRDMNSFNPQLPPDFLAEAAKRAQIACLMRDMGDVSL